MARAQARAAPRGSRAGLTAANRSARGGRRETSSTIDTQTTRSRGAHAPAAEGSLLGGAWSTGPTSYRIPGARAAPAGTEGVAVRSRLWRDLRRGSPSSQLSRQRAHGTGGAAAPLGARALRARASSARALSSRLRCARCAAGRGQQPLEGLLREGLLEGLLGWAGRPGATSTHGQDAGTSARDAHSMDAHRAESFFAPHPNSFGSSRSTVGFGCRSGQHPGNIQRAKSTFAPGVPRSPELLRPGSPARRKKSPRARPNAARAVSVLRCPARLWALRCEAGCGGQPLEGLLEGLLEGPLEGPGRDVDGGRALSEVDHVPSPGRPPAL